MPIKEFHSKQNAFVLFKPRIHEFKNRIRLWASCRNIALKNCLISIFFIYRTTHLFQWKEKVREWRNYLIATHITLRIRFLLHMQGMITCHWTRDGIEMCFQMVISVLKVFDKFCECLSRVHSVLRYVFMIVNNQIMYRYQGRFVAIDLSTEV